jgi:hypothetical protein
LKIRGEIVMNDAIAAVLNSWFEAYKKGDVDSVVAHHTDNASLFAPGAPRVDGTEALKATIQGMIDGGITYISHETTEADSREDIGYLLATPRRPEIDQRASCPAPPPLPLPVRLRAKSGNCRPQRPRSRGHRSYGRYNGYSGGDDEFFMLRCEG